MILRCNPDCDNPLAIRDQVTDRPDLCPDHLAASHSYLTRRESAQKIDSGADVTARPWY